ncbi:alanine--tRNA ligase [Flavobacteriales bacterium]|nr:alanine--tRNA ligase [Flavobacteriales bacterium]
MKASEIREKFIKFFKDKDHSVVPSSTIVAKNDPSLMFTNAGMNQFKSIFLADKSNNTLKRVVNSQKCLRVSGKHNDLEEVGVDHYHHTMFEMLGNWSFGDYFKEEIIKWSYELLTKTFGLNSDDLYVSIFQGDKNDKTSKDDEAFKIWSEIVGHEKIILGNKKDNFWEMGDSGPCGPCSEIHIDLRSDSEKSKIPGKNLVNMDHPSVIELWNLVFIQYNRLSNGTLVELPEKHIDTGMGFERLVRVIQKKDSNYDTDIFMPLIIAIEGMSDKKYGSNEQVDVAMRVIADHVRAVSFCICDGQIPGNTGAGYVVRRILRRAVRYGYTFLKIKTPFIHNLVNVISDQFENFFPELSKNKVFIKSIIIEEEISFLKTLSDGILKLDTITKDSKSTKVSGKLVFELYDTYGFPSDLTSLILREKNITYDHNEYALELEKQKSRSRSVTEMETEDWNILDNSNSSIFLGYDKLSLKTKINKYRLVSTKNKKFIQVVLNETPFYPEGGGQIGDRGYLESQNGVKIRVFNTKKENDEIIHFIETKDFIDKSEINVLVDIQMRKKCSSNHTATHLLHQALREILGSHIEQKGSMVSDKYLRFDFSHFKKIEQNILNEIEEFVNNKIDESIELVENRNQKYDEAIKDGVVALFGEKYGKVVRSIKFGNSYELCGGTHVQNTIQLRNFVILSESSIASGIRRIEAISGPGASKFLRDKRTEVSNISDILSSNTNLIDSVKNIKDQNTQISKDLKSTQMKLIDFYSDKWLGQVEKIKSFNFLFKKLNSEPSFVKSLCLNLSKIINEHIIILVTDSNNKYNIFVSVSNLLVESEGLSASAIIKSICDSIDGAGGGQSTFAAGSSPNNADIVSVITKIKESL